MHWLFYANKEVQDLAGKNVCAQSGSTSETQVKQKVPTVNVLPLQVISACVQAMKDGRVDAVSTDDIQLSAFPEFMRHDPVADLYYASAALDRYLDFVLVGLDGGKVVARAFSVPFALTVSLP